MDLKTFIKETIIDIDGALDEVSEEFSQYNYKFGYNTSGYKCINFEVQVYAAEGTGTDGGIGINVAGVKLGAKGESKSNSHELSKITFSVVRENTDLQNKKENEEFSKQNPIIEVDMNKFI